jgi:thioredoxin-dependent peroxiredoxin
VEVGDQVPEFELLDARGVKRSLTELLSRDYLVLFFYPMALTKGCTVESCHFRDLGSEFDALGATRVGVSHDRVEKLARFSELHTFDFPLLSDREGIVASSFGVKRNLPLLPNKRWTFVIDHDRRIVDIIKNEVVMSAHADRALETLRKRVAPTVR